MKEFAQLAKPQILTASRGILPRGPGPSRFLGAAHKSGCAVPLVIGLGARGASISVYRTECFEYGRRPRLP